MSERRMYGNKVTRFQTPNSGAAADRLLTLQSGNTRIAVANLSLAPGFANALFVRFGAECSGVADADEFVMPGGKEEWGIPSNVTTVSISASADFDVLISEGTTMP